MKDCYLKYYRFYNNTPKTEQQQAINKALLANIVEDIINHTNVSKDKLLTQVYRDDYGRPMFNRPLGTLIEFVLDNLIFQTDDQDLESLYRYLFDTLVGILERNHSHSLRYSNDFGCYIFKVYDKR